MRKIILVLFIGVLSLNMLAQQSDVDKLIEQGIALHDHGLYEDARSKFKQALAMDKTSIRAKYEMAYSSSAIKLWDDALHYSRLVLAEEGEYELEAYLVFCAALDNVGRDKQAIKFYKKAIKKYPDEHLLHYNIALTYLNQGEVDLAQEKVQQAIQINKYHMSSHFLLSQIMGSRGDRLKRMLPLYFFLLYEQDTERSIEAVDILQGYWRGAAMQTGNEVKVPISNLSSTSGLAVANMGLGLIAATYMVDEEKKNLEEPYKLAQQTTELLQLLDEVKTGELDFFDIYYVDFFSLLINAGHIEVYSHYISNCMHKDKVLLWVTENNAEFSSFMEWMKLQE